jgi:anthranilate synthase/phosphoribosyltransferase
MFLLIDNYDSFTFNLAQAFYSLGAEPLVARNDDPALLEYAANPELAGVCISPGPGHPDAAGLCLDFLQRLPSSVPVLGVCLGHQVLGRFAGAPVTVAARIVHGKASEIMHDGEGLFKNIPCPMRAGRYHSLLVQDSGENPSLRITARTGDGEIMGLALAGRPWFGVQFHPESVLTPEGVHLLGNFTAVLGKTGAEGKAGESSVTVQSAQAGADSSATADVQIGPAPFPLSEIMETLAKQENLPPVMAKACFARLMDGELSPAQAGAFLMGLRAKGETPEEMLAAVNAILERAVAIEVPQDTPVLDIVGTGGDGRFSFNCSSGAALVLAALGHRIVKHGNRSVSSRCGSADVLEGLGFDLDLRPEEISARVAEDNFVFLFAPRFHPCFRHIMPVRRELGVRTLFNLLGPLVNPARPGLCFLGVPNRNTLPLVADTLAGMGGRNGAVVYGAGGYDELTTLGPAEIALVRGGKVTFSELDPAEYGFKPFAPAELAISGPEEGVAVLKELLDGRGPEAMRQMLALNVGFGLHLLRPEQPLAACMAEARQAVASGVAGGFARAVAARYAQRRTAV